MYTDLHLITTDLITAHKRKERFRLYHIVEDDFATTITTKRELGLNKRLATPFRHP